LADLAGNWEWAAASAAWFFWARSSWFCLFAHSRRKEISRPTRTGEGPLDSVNAARLAPVPLPACRGLINTPPWRFESHLLVPRRPKGGLSLRTQDHPAPRSRPIHIAVGGEPPDRCATGVAYFTNCWPLTTLTARLASECCQLAISVADHSLLTPPCAGWRQHDMTARGPKHSGRASSPDGFIERSGHWGIA